MAGKKTTMGKSVKKAAAKKAKPAEKAVKPKKIAAKKAKPAAKTVKVKARAAKKKAAPVKKTAAKPKVTKKKAAVKAIPAAKKVKAPRKAPVKAVKKTKPVVKAKPKAAKAPPRKTARKREGLNAFFNPRSIALVGASESQGSLGRQLFETLTEGGFKGKVFPVNPKRKTVLEYLAFKTVGRIPGPVDIVILPTKKEISKLILEQCGKKNVKGLIIAASNYGKGTPKENTELRKILKKYGMRLLGLGDVGIGEANSGLNLDFSGHMLEAISGEGCLVSQSNTISEAVLRFAAQQELGIGRYISLGKCFDINENDCLQLWGKDKSIPYILLYLESFTDIESFMELCSEISKKKPIIALKPAMIASGDPDEETPRVGIGIADSLIWEKTGVIACDGIGDFFNTTLALGKLPIPEGNRAGIVSNGPGPGDVAASACRDLGVALPALQPKIQSSLTKALPKGAKVDNPINVPSSAGPSSYRDALQALVKDPTVDAIIAVYLPQGSSEDIEVAKIIAKTWTDMKSKRKIPKPVYPVWLADVPFEDDDPVGLLQEKGLPVYTVPYDVVKMMSNITTYKEWLTKPTGRSVRFEVNIDKANRIIHKAVSDKREYLDDAEGQDLLACYGIPTVTTVVTGSLLAARKHSVKMGYPIAVKGTSSGLIHRYEMKAVLLDVQTERELVAAYQKIDAQLKRKWHKPFRIMIQPMVKPGADLTIGAVRYEGYPPMLMFGLGGPFTPTPSSVDFKLVPLTDLDARALVEESIAYPMLKGGPGYGGAHIDGLINIIARFGRLIDNHREIVAADLNPFRAFPDKRFMALDQFFRIARR